MFVCLTTYQRAFTLDEQVVRDHWAYQDRAYAAGRMVCSGPQRPAVGGVLVIRGDDEEEARRLVAADPFVSEGVVTYRLIQFGATRGAHPDLIEASMS